MPRPSKGARLELRSARYDAKGRLTHKEAWIIRDGTKYIATGCATDQVEQAEGKLQAYLASKYAPKKKVQDIEVIPIADVLSIYLDATLESLRERFGVDQDREDDIPAIRKFKNRIGRLNDWWGDKMLSAVDGDNCRGYAKHRKNKGGARRDLEDLRAAIGYHASEGFHRGIIKVKLPGKGKPRDRWLTRQEAAKLLWACWRYREMQRRHRGKDKGKELATDKRPLQHLARFILIGLYTGTRAGAIASASPLPAIGRSYVDLERGIFYRLAEGQTATNKRQPPVPLPPRLLTHMRRWHDRKLIARHFVEFNGKGVKSVKTAFASAVGLAKLSGAVSPHTLRHTAATWLMQEGVDFWTAGGFLGMSPQMVEKVYGHHHPDHLRKAVEAFGNKRRQSVAVSVAVKKMEKAK